MLTNNQDFDLESTVLLIGKTVQPWAHCSRLTLMRWKLTLQLAPAREGIKRSPCLLGEDRGELVGVRARTAAADFYAIEENREHILTRCQKQTGLRWSFQNLIRKKSDNLAGRWSIGLRC